MSSLKMKFNTFLRFNQGPIPETKKNKIFIPPQIGDVNWRHVIKLKKSVIPKIYVPVILVTIWSALLKLFYDRYKEMDYIKYIFFPTSLLTYLGLVLSLLLVFRNNSAYDRFYEGRKSWASILNHARNLSRHIWICVDVEETDPLKDEKINLKKGVMRLIVALVISIRHSLRGEYGWDYDDLSELVKHVPRFNSLFTTAPIEVLKVLPLEIAYHIEGFLYSQKGIPTPMLNQSYNSLNAIIENFTTCERILNSPIPVIYGIHIKHALLIYLLTLPLQIIPTCSWAAVFIVLLTSFTLFGIEAISSEIENPFGKDRNDLKLDDFCQQVSDEINGMMKYFPTSLAVVDWFECEDIADPIIVDDKSSSVTLDIKDGSESESSSSQRSMKLPGKFPTVRAISRLAGKIPFRGRSQKNLNVENMKRASTNDSLNSEFTCINGSTGNLNYIQNYGSMNNGFNVNPLNNIGNACSSSSNSSTTNNNNQNPNVVIENLSMSKPPVNKEDQKVTEKKDNKLPEKVINIQAIGSNNKDTEKKDDKKVDTQNIVKKEDKKVDTQKVEKKEDKKVEKKEDKKVEKKVDKKEDKKIDKKDDKKNNNGPGKAPSKK